MDPFVLGLDAARAGVPAQIVLKRTETDERLLLVRLLIGQTAGCDELPALEIHVALQVLFPGALHRRLEGQHQHLAPAHLLRQLIGGEGLAETHLGVPEEVRRLVPVAPLLAPTGEVGRRLLDRRFLLRPHLEIQRPVLLVQLAGPHGDDGRLDLGNRATEPLAFRVLDAVDPQHPVNVMVGEHRPVIAHGGFFENDPVRRLAGLLNVGYCWATRLCASTVV